MDLPDCFGVPFEGFAKNRLGLAQWLFSRDNALTSRVFVNRIWQQHFGTGLVKTAEDFGSQGALPSHPELLDWLAHNFVQSGWDIKQLHKHILTSAAYQRATIIDPVKRNQDLQNRWMTRGPSQRLSAEMIRDNALAISGLLVDRLGGPSVYPYQPAGLWDELSNKSWRYPYLQEPGEGLYRRSLYTIWKRTSPPPSMLLFDVPDRSFCTVQRNQTNTPQQALALLNDPTYVEAARVLAAMISNQFAETDDKLRQVFRKTLGRYPVEKEFEYLRQFYHSELERIQKDEIDWNTYLSNGELREVYENPEKVTALAITAHNLLNSYEAQMKK